MAAGQPAESAGPPGHPRWRGVHQRFARSRSDLRVEVPAHVSRRIAVDNVRRIRIVCALALVISATSLTLFALLEPTHAVEATWRWRILGGHAVLLAVVVGLLVVVTRPPWREPGLPTIATSAIRGVEWSAVAALLIVGCYFSWADQEVTDSITPFVIVCVLLGLLVLVRPARSVPTFGLAAVVFAVLLQTTAVSGESIVASTQVNGVSAAALGLMLAVVRYTTEVRSLVQQTEIERQRAALEQANAALTHTAAHDELTGLVNRREANRCIAAEVERLRRRGGVASLLLLDVDRFKRVNDRFGHPAGDQLLVRLAEVLRSRLRRVDVVARWGGEEFLVLLVATDAAAAVTVAEELRSAIGSQRFCLEGYEDVPVTVSVGVVGLHAQVAGPMEVAYRQVDEALYAAKESGRDRVVLAPALQDAGIEGQGSDPPGVVASA